MTYYNLLHFFQQEVLKKIKRLKSEQGTVSLISQRLLNDLEQTEKILNQKDVRISVFGQHNCGKSTFINALIGGL